ncbi:meiosis initiator protein isoform X2 [Dendropsophus ebraccatus]|uniref:meiosis initiator protein isoform X2 n=1 Tax=Dendropsophus ebraccatus TaxID=150705 RepID=UPI00383180D4
MAKFSSSSPVSVASSGSRPRVQNSRAPRGRIRRSVDMVELAKTLPGGQWKERGAQKLLVRVISYIQFLQRQIQETQSKLIPHSSRHGFAVKPKLKSKQILQQRLVPYVSSSSSNNGDGSPWLVSVIPHSPNRPCTPQFSSAAPLELSPLLMSLPSDLLSQGLFEEVQLHSQPPDDLQDLGFSLNHSYQSCDKSSGTHPPQPTQKSKMVARRLDLSQKRPAEGATGSGFSRCLQVYNVKSKAKRVQTPTSTSRDDVSSSQTAGTKVTTEPRAPSRLQQLRKKCVNGFIMFCRLNRRPYLSAYPGKASTAATKDLAELWRLMSARERRPYCVRALQFSLLHDRMVRSSSSRLIPPYENVSPPKPLSVLLAEKAAQFQEYTGS